MRNSFFNQRKDEFIEIEEEALRARHWNCIEVDEGRSARRFVIFHEVNR